MQVVERDGGRLFLGAAPAGDDRNERRFVMDADPIDMFQFLTTENALTLRFDVGENEVIARWVDHRLFVAEKQTGIELRSNTEDSLQLKLNRGNRTWRCHV